MQTKKEEINLSIIKAAEREFFLRGFKEASLRKIAERAHTSIGNLYNYYASKEALFSAVIDDTVIEVDKFITFHEESHVEIESIINEIDTLLDEHANLFPLDLLASQPFLILLKGCEGTRYESLRKELIDRFSAHMAAHMGVEPDDIICEIMIRVYIDGIIFIGEKKIKEDEKMKHLKNYIMTAAFGVLKNYIGNGT